MRKKVITILTCIVMTMAFMPVYAFAATASSTGVPFHYVALGDASTAGFGMTETKNIGYKKLVKGTYPALIGSALTASGFNVTVDQLADSGMRIEELRALLDDSYNGDAYTRENFPNLQNRSAKYKQSIKNADLITYSLGAVNVGSYLLYLAGDPGSRCDDPDIKALVDADSDGIKQSLNQALDAAVAEIKTLALSNLADVDELVNSYSGSYIDAAAYAYYSFRTSYEATIEQIRALNPNADLVVLGIDNMLGNLNITVAESQSSSATIRIGQIYNDRLVQVVNNLMADTVANTAGNNVFVETGTVEKFLDEVRTFDGDINHISDQFKLYCDVLEDDLRLTPDIKNYITKPNPDGLGFSLSGTKGKKALTCGMMGVYRTAAVCLQNVAEIEEVTFSGDDLAKLKDKTGELSGVGQELMAGFRDKCMANGRDAVNQSLTRELKDINWSNLDPYLSGTFYGSEKNLGRLIMAIGIHTQMGDGFFQHPSANGHKQISDTVLQGIHVPGKAPACTAKGINECWIVFNAGKAKWYSDAACTQETTLSACTVAALGHKFGAWKVTKKADVGVVGTKTRTCTRAGCTVKETASIAAKNPVGTKIVKKTGGKKSFTVKWAKPSAANLKKITGYQVRYSLKKSMAGAKKVTVKKSTVTKTVKKLKAKKYYYVQVRTYKKTGTKYYYSAWSAKKAVKTK